MTNKETITKKVKRIDEIVKYFEDSKQELDLDKDLEYYTEAAKLAKEVEEILSGYELKINEIKEKFMDE